LYGCVGIILLGWLIWAIGHTESPSPAVAAAAMALVAAAAVLPWALLAARRLGDDEAGRGIVLRGVFIATLIATAGVAAALVLGDPNIVMASILVAGAFALVGGVLAPWTFLATRAVARERARRVRAEERAQMAAHLHDSVLQTLTLIQKGAEDPSTVRRLARGTERELRVWLYGAPVADSSQHFAAAVKALAEEVEDRFAVTVELVAVGTCAMDERARAVLGAMREALTNAAKHAGVQHVSLFAEVADTEILVLVRDRGRGFDPAVDIGPDRRGIADSIKARVLQAGGGATIRSTAGEGTEVELRMPLAVRT
jgi:signal transduction histidine kinase